MFKLRVALVMLAVVVAAAGAAEEFRLEYGGEYGFYLSGPQDLEDEGFGMNILSREVTPRSQDVYIHIVFYAVHSGRVDETNAACRNNYFLLENEEGVAYEPVSVHYVVNQTLFETACVVYKFKYVGDFRGELHLVAQVTGEAEPVRLDMGPADRNFYRTGVVKASAGLILRAAPTSAAPAVMTLRPGDTYYATGRYEFFWPEEDTAWYDCVTYDEVIVGDTRGWISTYDNTIRLAGEESPGYEEPPEEDYVFTEEGDFAPQ